MRCVAFALSCADDTSRKGKRCKTLRVRTVDEEPSTSPRGMDTETEGQGRERVIGRWKLIWFAHSVWSLRVAWAGCTWSFTIFLLWRRCMLWYRNQRPRVDSEEQLSISCNSLYCLVSTKLRSCQQAGQTFNYLFMSLDAVINDELHFANDNAHAHILCDSIV